MKILTMKEWSQWRVSQGEMCYQDGGRCSPNPSIRECVDCYGEYVDSSLPQCDKKVVIRRKTKDVEGD